MGLLTTPLYAEQVIMKVKQFAEFEGEVKFFYSLRMIA